MAEILIVEDERIVAEDIKQRLKNLGYSSSVASSGEGAIQKAEKDTLDLVLMDIVLGGKIDGIETAQTLHSQFDIPVIFLTAHADERTLEHAKLTEPYGYILKPFEDRELHASIKMALYKHEMEKKMKKSHQQLITTLKSMGDAVIATDKEGVITFMNPVAEALTGWVHEEAQEKSLEQVFTIMAENGKLDCIPVRAILNEGATQPLARHILLTKDGRRIFIDYGAAPIKDENRIIGIVVAFRDITEHKRTEEALKSAEKKFRELFDSAGDALFIHDMEGHFLETNKTACERLGYKREELLQLTSMNIDAPEYAAAVSDRIKKIKTEGHAFLETAHITRDGRRIPIEMSSRIIEFEGKSAVLNIARDITDRKRAEEALQSEKDKLQALLDGLARVEMGITIIGKGFTIQFQNQTLEERFGDVTGRLCYESYLGTKEACPFCPISRTLVTNNVESAGITGPGGTYYQIISAPFPNPDGSVDRALEVVIDVTEHKRAEIQLRKLFETSKLINSTMDMDKIFEFISDSYRELVGFDNFIVFLVSEEKNTLYVAYASEGIRDKVKDIVTVYGEGLIGHAVRHKETLLLGNAHEDSRSKGIPGVTDSFTSLIVFPLTIEEECVGAIHISKIEENAYDEDDVEAIKLLSEIISSAVRNSRLYHEIKEFGGKLEMRIAERSRRIEILLKTRLSLQKEGGWEKGLATIIESMLELGFERVGIFLVDPMRKALDFHTGRGIELPESLSVSLKDTDFFGVKCVREKRTIHVREYNPKEGRQVVSNSKSFVWVPIMVQNEAFAALAADNVKSGKMISEEDVKDLEILAGMCAVFIDRTRLLVEPVAEKRLETAFKYWLNTCEGYLVLEKRPEKSLEIFLDLVTHGIPGFVVSRVYPERLKRKYTLARTPVLWFSRSAKEDTIGPDDLPKLIYVISDFTKKSEESVILLEGLEYLVTQVGFETVLKAVQELRDIVVMNNSRLIVPFRKDTLSEREYSILEREFTVL
ncbi:MAG: PAS domain S-box protein [Theionarchaea archaeon]|nr:PAS domain S-box protein [Theionarchaea archaeon]